MTVWKLSIVCKLTVACIVQILKYTVLLVKTEMLGKWSNCQDMTYLVSKTTTQQQPINQLTSLANNDYFTIRRFLAISRTGC